MENAAIDAGAGARELLAEVALTVPLLDLLTPTAHEFLA